MSFDIDVSQFLDFAEQMGASEKELKDAWRAGGNRIASFGANLAKSLLAGNGSVVTGRLYGSIKGKPTQISGSSVIIEYGPDSEYPGKWVEKGRGPVHAYGSGTLAFQIKGRGPYIYARSVGPAAAKPFMQPTIPQVRAMAVKVLGEALMRIISR